MYITDLPSELIALLPNYLHTLDDLYALIQTSRYFYTLCSDTKAKYPPILRQKDGQYALPPHPDLLLCGVARQIADWAVKSGQNRQILWDAISDSSVDRNVGLLQLGEQVARLGLRDVRALYKANLEIVDPISRIIDREVGRKQGHDQKSETNSGAGLEIWGDRPRVICEQPKKAMYNFVIYSELFHHSVDNAYGQLSNTIEPLSVELRHHWMRWCMPDVNCSYQYPLDSPSGKALKEEGQYQQLDFHQLLRSPTSENIPHQVFGAEKPVASDASKSREDWDETASQHDRLAEKILEHQGLNTLRLHLPGGPEATKDMISDIREKVGKIPVHQVEIGPSWDDDGKLRGWSSMMLDVMSCMGWV